MAEKVLAGLSERAQAYIEGLLDERDELQAQVDSSESVISHLEQVRIELESKVLRLEEQMQTNPGLANALAREVSRSVDLRRAVEQTMVNIGGPGSIQGIPASNAGAVRTVLSEALRKWEADGKI